ncbi:hypothetical protein JCM5296_005565 [Sporobolomyces johnsonii]
MPPDWSYKVSIKPSHPAAPSLALVAGAAVPPTVGPDSLFAASTVTLAVSLAVDSEDLAGQELLSGALAREVVTWLDEHKASLGLDSVGTPSASPSGINSLPSALAADSPGLDRINLSLTFRSASTSIAALNASQSQFQPQFQAALPAISLTSQLLAPSPQSLHFTLSPLVAQGLAKLATKLSTVFPLCFNPKWVDRLTKDLPAQRALATSLISTFGPDNSSDSRKTLDPDVAREAARLQHTLSLQLAAQYPSGTGTGTASSRPSSPSSSRPSAQASLEKALLLIAKHTLSPDVWSPSSCATNNANQPGTAKKGKGQKRSRTEEGAKGEGGGGRKAKRAKGGKGTTKMRRKEQDREDDEALAVMGCESYGEGGGELEVEGQSELGGLEGFEDLVARAEDEEGGGWEEKEKGEYAALEQEGEEEDLALGFDDEDEEQGWRVEGVVLSGDDAGDREIDERFVADGRDDPDGMELLIM